MKISDIALPDDTHGGLSNIKNQCTTFIETCADVPLYKLLPTGYSSIHKVKVRKSKRKTDFSHTFNLAFEQQQHDLMQRAIFANGINSFISESSNDSEPFYVFPIDGFKYMYCTEVDNSTDNYKKVFETVMDTFGQLKGTEMITELLQFTYRTDNIREGIMGGAELIIYDIPYYFAVRVSSVESYSALINSISEVG